MITSRRWRYLLPLIILWLALGLRLYQIDFQSIWWDEGHSIFVAEHPIPQIPTLPAMDVHPPGYFALLHLWMAAAGRSEFALRYLSTIFSLLTVALLWPFARSLSGKRGWVAPLAALFAAISPMYVAYGQEVRSYAMMTCLALASTFALWKTLQQASPNKKISGWLLLYIMATAAGLYTHYFTVFLLLFQNLAWAAWVIWRRPRPIWPQLGLWWGAQGGVLLLFAPQLALALRQVTSYTNPNLVPPTLAHFTGQSWQAYTVGLTISPTLARWGMGGIAAVLAISWIIIFIRNPHPAIRPFLFLTGWFLLPLAAYFVVLQRQPSFEPRYMMLVTPALFLLLALGVGQAASSKWHAASHHPTSHIPHPTSHISHPTSHIPRPTQHATRLLFFAIPTVIFLMGLYSYYTNETYFKDDSAGVAAWLAAKTTPNDIVYIDVPHPFHYYARQQNIPAPTRYLFVDIHTAAGTLTREAADKDRLFWVTWWGSDTDPRRVIPFLAQKAGQKAGEQDFKGYHVEWYDLPAGSPTTFSLPNTLTPIDATFGSVLRLDGAAFSHTTPAGEPVWATLHFTLLQETDVNYKVSLRLRDEAGQIVAQRDKELLNDRHFRTAAWPLTNPALNQATNVYLLPLPPDTLPGSYRLEAVVYNARPPYPSEGVSGHPNSDGVAAILGRVTVVP